MPEGSFPPQTRRSTALYAAGGGFGGALLAIIVAKLLEGPCCCAPTQPVRGANDLVAPAAAMVAPEQVRP